MIANAVFEPLFDAADAAALEPLARLAAMPPPRRRPPGPGSPAPPTSASSSRGVGACLAELPFLFAPRLDAAAVAGLGERLAGL